MIADRELICGTSGNDPFPNKTLWQLDRVHLFNKKNINSMARRYSRLYTQTGNIHDRETRVEATIP
jgi:hypothetical protein